MPTPAYGIKHWWRACRSEGESLKHFARRHRGEDRRGKPLTSETWFANKRRNPRT